MSSMTSRRKLHQLSLGEWQLLVCATVALAIMRVAVGVLPFRTITRALGLHEGRSAQEIDRTAQARAARIGWAVRSAAAHAPWRSTCLMQALAAAGLLRIWRIDATLYLGVGRDEASPDGLAAHAWLRCGGLVLTGEAGRVRFAELASFATG